jgi:dipeptidyl aminopeptidase/acylaminoacyl peptidase
MPCVLILIQACLGGSCPWVDVEPPHLKDNPVKDVKKVRIPLLILHGKENQRVPVSQATGFMRALVRAGNIGAKSQLVIYPREGSKFEERAHAVDVCRRLLEYLNARLK